MLEALDLAGVRGERRLFDHLTFRIVPGECLSVHGENGSGKPRYCERLQGSLRLLLAESCGKESRCATSGVNTNANWFTTAMALDSKKT